MQKFLCWFLGHDRMSRSSSHRICLRCGQKEQLQNLGHVIAWVDVTRSTKRT